MERSPCLRVLKQKRDEIRSLYTHTHIPTAPLCEEKTVPESNNKLNNNHFSTRAERKALDSVILGEVSDVINGFIGESNKGKQSNDRN